ncbi:MAG: cytochrome c biogenesis protein CcdA [Coriobacteriia bacterium]|nr:cytochrome c biogenesis protein CcdA [Coriobacteriia bacterium]
MSASITLAAAFAAGLVSFLSPCVLPLIPAYVSFMTGMSLAELTSPDRRATKLLGPVLLFVAGFTVVFVALGAGASVLGSLLNANRVLLTRFAGIVLLLLGVILLDVVPVPLLRGGAGVNAATFRRFGGWASLVLGLAFPFALGPCAGPVYGAILTLAVDSRSVGVGSLLLLVYSIGLAVPFIATALLLDRAAVALKWLSRHAKLINRIAGAVLVAMGLAMITGFIDSVGIWLRAIPVIGSIG